jgi:hypothetical protein
MFAVFGVLALALAGCKDPYTDVADRQLANWNETADILRGVHDQPTMDAAERKLLLRAAHFQELSRRAKALPLPDEATARRLEARRETMQAAFRGMLREIERVKKLPEGPEFFERVKEALTP